MWEPGSLLPAQERGAFKRILLGFFFLLIAAVLLYHGNAYIAFVVTKLQGRDFGPMLFGSVCSMLVHGTQVLSLLMAWVLIGKGVGYYFSSAPLAVNILFSSVGIWLSWVVPPLFFSGLSYTFPLNIYMVILSVALFQILTLYIENWIDKGTAMLLWVYSFQSLELLPSFPTDTEALSNLFRSMYRTNEEAAVASMAGTALSLSFMAGALISTWLLARYSIRLGQVRQYWEKPLLNKKEPEDSIAEVNMVDIRTLVHDLKNPLAAIKGMSMMLCEGENAEKAEIMLKAANYMERMIGEILREDQRSPIEVSYLIDNLERHVRPFPWAEHLSVTVAPEAEKAILSVNEIRMIRALLNILDNAWRANRVAGTKAIELRVRLNSRYLEIEIMDNGPGYGTLSNAYLKSGWGSTGLGLAFVRKVVLSHGGNILLSQRTDSPNGTSALISMPIATLEPEPEPF